MGLHTFRYGDTVEYIGAPGETVSPKATVVGLAVGRRGTNNQGDKLIVLRCETTSTFFISKWPSWQRMPRPGMHDVTDDGSVAALSPEDRDQMWAAFVEARPLDHFPSFDKAHHQADKAPPGLQVSCAYADTHLAHTKACTHTANAPLAPRCR